MKSQFLWSFAIVLQASYLCGTEINESPTKTTTGRLENQRPNIILCMADDQGWGDVGFNGHPILKTPHLDRLANSGLTFNRFYAAAPVCSPTRGSCLTGRHPYRYGIFFANRGHMKNDEILLSEILQRQGYRTGHFGKWHLGTLTTKIFDANRGKPGNTEDYAPPWEHGFDVCFSTESKVPTFDPMVNPGVESKATKKGVPQGGEYGTHYWTGQDQRVPDDQLGGDDSMLIVDRAIEFVRDARKDDQPFFAVIWFHAPHLPVVASAEKRSLYPDHPFGLYGQHYLGCISAIDDAVGRLTAELEKMNELDQTMFWYCSDNGPEGKQSNAPGSAGLFRGRKRDLYEGGVRVPAFLHWPDKIQSPQVSCVPCVTSDYFPTILDQLEIPLPDRPYDGISLLPLLDGKVSRRDEPIGFQSKRVATWNSDRFKLVVTEQSKKEPKIELFDIVADISEKNNLASRFPEHVQQMRKALSDWQQSCKRSDRGADY
jgi:arylsulfatase A-like enzyme